jgi:hypothetical protein
MKIEINIDCAPFTPRPDIYFNEHCPLVIEDIDENGKIHKCEVV